MYSTLALMKLYAEQRRVALSTLGRLMIGSSTLADRMTEGRVTVATIRRVEQWLSDHWPESAEWPADIPRPAPDRKEAA